MKKSKSGIANRDLVIILSIIAVVIIAVVVIIIVANSKGKTPVVDANNVTPPVVDVNTPVTTENPSKDNVNVSSDGTKINKSENLLKEKTFEGLAIKNITLSAKSGLTKFKASVVNNTGKDVAGKPIQIVFTDKDGKTTKVLDTYLGAVKNGKTTEIDASCTIDLSNAYDFTIKNK